LETTIRNPIALRFDPATADEEIRAVFADDIARTLWLAIKQWHLTSQHFNELCLEASRLLRVCPPATFDEFHRLMRRVNVPGRAVPALDSFEQGISREFFLELWPLVNGEHEMRFTVPGDIAHDTTCPGCRGPAESRDVTKCSWCGETYCPACSERHKLFNCSPETRRVRGA
jgi:hypothetical protein